MSTYEKFRLIRECFPKSWKRKTVFLYPFLPSDVAMDSGKAVGMCTTVFGRIILLCVSESHRRKGIASELVKRSSARVTYTHSDNAAAIKFWERNSFKIKRKFKTPFGEMCTLVRV
jgi:ribosomal protein S18 acetylase RimI-like enzyme